MANHIHHGWHLLGRGSRHGLGRSRDGLLVLSQLLGGGWGLGIQAHLLAQLVQGGQDWRDLATFLGLIVLAYVATAELVKPWFYPNVGDTSANHRSVLFGPAAIP